MMMQALMMLAGMAIAGGVAAQDAVPLPQGLSAAIPNLKHPDAKVLTGGEPTAAAWPLLEQAGVTTVVNLRADDEMVGNNEAAAVAAAGMHYVHIPVAGGPDVTRANAELLHAALAGAKGKVLVHCASGNRAGALLAIDAAMTRGLDADAAVRFGQSAGLTGLEPRVREVLAAPAKP